jgi:hypothetical protein
VASDVLTKAYKALQFFDMLALWLQVTHPHGRPPMVWEHVPGRGSDHAVHIEQVDDTRVRLDPYPFDTVDLPILITGRHLSPQPATTDLMSALEGATPGAQDVLLTV